VSTTPIRAASVEALQSFRFDRTLDEQIAGLVERFPTRRAALIPTLWLLQERYGWISPEVIEATARRLGESPAFVEGVVTFYTMFRTSPPARYVLQVCTTLSCAVCGATELLAHLHDRLGIGPGEKTLDGLFQIVGVQCLGACGGAPVIQVNDDYYENLDASRLDALLGQLTGRP